MHTTQFAIRDAGLYEPVLRIAARDGARMAAERPAACWSPALCGRTAQARAEARLARGLGYHAGLLSLARDEGRHRSTS